MTVCNGRVFLCGAGVPVFDYVSVGARVRALTGSGALFRARLRFSWIGAGNRVVEGERVLGMVPRVLWVSLGCVLGMVPMVL